MKRTLLAILMVSIIAGNSLQAMSFFDEEEESFEIPTEGQYPENNPKTTKKSLAEQLEELESQESKDNNEMLQNFGDDIE